MLQVAKHQYRWGGGVCLLAPATHHSGECTQLIVKVICIFYIIAVLHIFILMINVSIHE